MYKPRREASEETASASTLTLDCSLRSCEGMNSVVETPRSVVLGYGSPSRRRHVQADSLGFDSWNRRGSRTSSMRPVISNISYKIPGAQQKERPNMSHIACLLECDVVVLQNHVLRML